MPWNQPASSRKLVTLVTVVVAASSEPGTGIYKTRDINNPKNSQTALLIMVATELTYDSVRIQTKTHLQHYLYKPTISHGNNRLTGEWYRANRMEPDAETCFENWETTWKIIGHLTDPDLILDLQDKLQEYIVDHEVIIG